jgi:hypothetical protein
MQCGCGITGFRRPFDIEVSTTRESTDHSIRPPKSWAACELWTVMSNDRLALTQISNKLVGYLRHGFSTPQLGPSLGKNAILLKRQISSRDLSRHSLLACTTAPGSTWPSTKKSSERLRNDATTLIIEVYCNLSCFSYPDSTVIVLVVRVRIRILVVPRCLANEQPSPSV